MGDLDQTLSSEVVVSNNLVRVGSGSISNLSMKINAKNGEFSGSFIHAGTQRKTAYRGVLMPGFGGGWFLGPNQGGAVRLDVQH